jgi:protein SCO1
VFITIDPERDSGKLINEYVKEFHPRMIGLRGSLEEIKKVAKLFRVYFMKTNDSKTDYLVDHSIIMVCSSPTVLCFVLCVVCYKLKGKKKEKNPNSKRATKL